MEVTLNTNLFYNGKSYKAGTTISTKDGISEEVLIHFCKYEGIPINTGAKIEDAKIENIDPVVSVDAPKKKRGRRKKEV